jgi:hypothetical protein
MATRCSSCITSLKSMRECRSHGSYETVHGGADTDCRGICITACIQSQRRHDPIEDDGSRGRDGVDHDKLRLRIVFYCEERRERAKGGRNHGSAVSLSSFMTIKIRSILFRMSPNCPVILRSLFPSQDFSLWDRSFCDGSIHEQMPVQLHLC